MTTMDWQQIVQRDPFLAGVIAAAEWLPGGRTPEALADVVGLASEARQRFINGWNTAMEDDEAQRQVDLEKRILI